MWTIKGGKIYKPDAKRYVESAMNSIGLGTFTFGYAPHAFYYLGVKFWYLIAPRIYKGMARKVWRRDKID